MIRPTMSLAAHPRLYVSAAQLRTLRRSPTLPFLRDAAKRVAKLADQFVADTTLRYDVDLHNSLLLCAREMQTRVVTLLVRWKQTGEACYRDAALRDTLSMGEWTHWGWDSLIKGDARPEAEFDLSYGENSATLAITYDWLAQTLSDDERQRLIGIARKWTVKSFLFHARGESDQTPFWYGHPQSNWNSVCAGGAGMVALAMHEHLPEAGEIVAHADQSITPYMQSLAQTNGGWVEGIGYWNYGHRYAFMYLLSHSRATGKTHPLLLGPGVRETLSFPIAFCPNGQHSSFGDVNRWRPLPFHYAAAEILKARDVLRALDAVQTKNPPGIGAWPDDAELLVLHPGRPSKSSAKSKGKPVVKHYPSMDWFVLADRLPGPALYLSARGGTTEVPHAHRDLLSFHCVVGDEQLITNLGINGGGDYLDTTFSSRRQELFETQPASKNTILINGVGIAEKARVQSTVLRGRGFNGIRMDATEAMGISRGDRPAATFCARLFLMLGGDAILIIDRVDLPTTGRVESRMHSASACDGNRAGFLIRGRRQQLRVTYSCDVPAAAHLSITAPTTPGPGASVLRWCTDSRTHLSVTMATLLSPGRSPAKLKLDRRGDSLSITAAHRGKTWRVRTSVALDGVRLASPK